MGNSPSKIIYSRPVEGSEKPNHSRIYRYPEMMENLIDNLVETPLQNCWDNFQLGKSRGDPNRPFLGSRVRKPDGSLGQYKFKSYAECEKIAIYFGSGLIKENAVKEHEFDESVPGARKMRPIAIMARNCEGWILTELASQAFGLTMVPLYETFGSKAMTHVIQEARLGCCMLLADCFTKLIETDIDRNLKYLIFFDKPGDDVEAISKERGIKYYTFEQIVKIGEQNPHPITPPTRQDINTICYTSGTTGLPKGCLISQGTLVACLSASRRGQMRNPAIRLNPDDVHLSYLPLPHIFERFFLNLLILGGGICGVYSGDTAKLLEDIQELQPTFFISVPRLYNRIHDKIFAGVEKKGNFAQMLFRSGLNAKLSKISEKGIPTHLFWDTLVFKRTKSLLGERCKCLVVGGAPLDGRVQAIMSALFCCPFLEGFGMTEVMGAAFLSDPTDPVKGHSGGPVPSVEFRLRDIPDMNYLSSANPPKGELCIRGHSVALGYFKRPEESASVFDEDGFFLTGDIAALLPTNGIKVIDRKKNIFKLAQGEYVSPEKIEGVLQSIILLSQAFVYGISTKNALVSVVVPDEETGATWLAERNIPAKPEEVLEILSRNSDFKADCKNMLEDAYIKFELKGFEKPKAFCISAIPFTIENDLITPTMKLKRHNAKNFFQKQIDAMHEEIGE